jgi:hypothetical protein
MGGLIPVYVSTYYGDTVKSKWLVKWILIACLTVFLLASCSGGPSTHVLFIGNSYTFYNGGIDKQLEGLAPASKTASISVGGYTLNDHWNDGNALKEIRKGGWQYVVLQEQSQTSVINYAMFLGAIRKFDAEIRKNGAQTVLLMTWERPDSVRYGVTTANLANAYNSAGAALDVKGAPAGLAFARSLRERPDLQLYSQDGHPTIYGTYLASCVLYDTIFAKSPVGNWFRNNGINADEAAYLQQIAAETLGY